VKNISAFLTTAITEFRFAFFALNEKQVTIYIRTIGVGVTGFATLMTVANDVIGDTFSESLIEDEILPFELTVKPFLFDFAGV
jgi:hypothetical protein